MNQEMIFDNASAVALQRKLEQSGDVGVLNFDVSKIQWTNFVQNHAYGIKRYILHEEAYLPSQGYYDARHNMFNTYTHRILNPFSSKIFQKNVRSYEKTKELVFKSAWVQKEIKKMA